MVVFIKLLREINELIMISDGYLATNLSTSVDHFSAVSNVYYSSTPL